MKKRVWVYILAIAFVLVYLFFINAIAYSLYASSNNEELNTNSENNGDIKLGVSDSVDVSVTRPRFYGTIIENSSKNTKISLLYLLNIIKIPLNSGGISFLFIHILFLIVLIFFIYLSLKKIRKFELERGYM